MYPDSYLQLDCHLLAVVPGEAVDDSACQPPIHHKLGGYQLGHVLKALVALLLAHLIPAYLYQYTDL